MNKVTEFIKKIPKEILYTLLIFFITRFALTIIGTATIEYNATRQTYSPNSIFNIWGLWDTAWYINIAKNGYSAFINVAGEANYGFFPLYPILIKFFQIFTQNYFIASLIVSNLFLILSAIFLYKLTRLDSDEKTSLRSIKYLFLFPGAFILSAALSESLFLFLIIICFYYAKKRKWFISGMLGMLLTLTKPFGIIIILPIVYEYIKDLKLIGKINLIKIIKDGLSISLIPLGLGLFAFYTYLLTGDIMAYPHTKQAGWGNYLSNPLNILYSSLTSGFVSLIWGATTAILIIAILIFFYKKIGFSYFLIGITIALFGISYTLVMPSMLRYYTAIFPLYIIFAKITEDRESDNLLMIFFLLLQGFLMAFWTIQSGIII